MCKTKHSSWNWMNQMSLVINSRPAFQSVLHSQCLWSRSILLLCETHTRLWLHPAPPRTSFIVYSESSVAPTHSPCGLDQSVVIMLIWAVSHWEKKKGVKSVCACVCVRACVCCMCLYVVGLHLSECDYSARSLWNSLCINNYSCPLGHRVKGLFQTRLWKRGLGRILWRCVAEENMSYSSSIQTLFNQCFHLKMICSLNQTQLDCYCFLLF